MPPAFRAHHRAPRETVTLVRRPKAVLLADVDHEHHALLAGFEMCDLPDQLLDFAAGGLRVDPGQAGVVQLDFNVFKSIMAGPFCVFGRSLENGSGTVIESFCSANVLVNVEIRLADYPGEQKTASGGHP